MRWLFLCLFIPLSACGDPHALTYTSPDAPRWAINPQLWNGGGNAITTAPTLPSGIGPQAAR